MKSEENLVAVTLQLPKHTVEFYKQHYSSYTDGMCKALKAHEARVSPSRYKAQVKCNVI